MLKSVTTVEASLYVIVYCGEDTGKLLLNRLHEQAEILPESQGGFRKDGRTIDIIFSVRHFQEEYQKQNMDLSLHDLCRHYQLTQSVVMGFGKL